MLWKPEKDLCNPYVYHFSHLDIVLTVFIYSVNPLLPHTFCPDTLIYNLKENVPECFAKLQAIASSQEGRLCKDD